MKRLVGLILIVIIAQLAGSHLNGQCVPHPENCVDTGEPGEICPSHLPEATVNIFYDQEITVIPPGEVSMGGFTFIIDYIIVDSVKNLPAGISYAANAVRFYADTAYCIQISGTPLQAGVDTLAIYVTPFIKSSGTTVPGPQAVNDTSIVMTVQEPAGVKPARFNEFNVLPNIPNPFSEVTRIGFFTPFDDQVELKVYSILGELMHEEKNGYPPGDHYFGFDGYRLHPGTYFYRVTNHEKTFTGKFIKAKS